MISNLCLAQSAPSAIVACASSLDLMRTRRNRPHCRTAPKQPDEGAQSHVPPQPERVTSYHTVHHSLARDVEPQCQPAEQRQLFLGEA